MDSPPASPRIASSLASEPPSPSTNVELTPRSKVRALLGLDEDSDFDDPSTKPTSPSRTRKSSSPLVIQPTSRQSDKTNSASEKSGSDSDSDVASHRPMGRTAARLRGKNISSEAPQPTTDREESDEDDVISKVRRQLVRVRSVSLEQRPGSEENDDHRVSPKHVAVDNEDQSTPRSLTIDELTTNENVDVDVEDRLTQQTRPSRRKASRKAMDELNRETQRMARNQQLAHQAKVRRKFTVDDLLQRFENHKDTVNAPLPAQLVPVSSPDDQFMMSGALASSDVDASVKVTPPTSPVHRPDGMGDDKRLTVQDDEEEEELPSLEKLLEQSANNKKHIHDAQFDNLFSRAATSRSKAALSTKSTHTISNPRQTTRQFRVIVPQATHLFDSSDDDLMIVKPKVNKALELLNNPPENKLGDSSTLLRLRHLANLTSPGKKRKGNHMSATELQAQLREKARQQAIKEKEERIADLRARGVHVQSFEEREKEQLELENLLEKARVEAVDIAKKEKAAARKAGVDVDDHDVLDDEDDEDWDGEDEAEGEESEGELALSGSEDENEMDGDEDEQAPQPFFDMEAGDSDGEDVSQNIAEVFSIFKKKPVSAKEDDNSLKNPPTELEQHLEPIAKTSPSASVPETNSDSDDGPAKAAPRHSRRRVVFGEDDEDQETASKTATPNQKSPNDEARAVFGFAAQPPMFGLSQLMDSTLAGEDSQASGVAYDPNQDSLALLRDLPDGSAPQFATPRFTTGFVLDSQGVTGDKTAQAPLTQVNLGISQFPEFAQSQTDISPTKMSEMIEPTQDAGFAMPRFPLGAQIESQSTVATEMLTQQETPAMKKKGRLMRRAEVIAELSEEDSDANQGDIQPIAPSNDAFNALLKGAKRSAAKADFDKKKSAAKGLVEEQAEESEDEYAGLGGASDDESNGEVDEEMQKMMDDGHVNVNEQAVQALHADKQRAEDEKRLNQLYKDITTGRLRRKRGAAGMDDLSDHEDDEAERRRRKQEEFARMRRALLADEKIGKIAQNPKQQAFFHAIEDREEFNSLDYMDRPEQEVIPATEPEEKVEAEQSDSSESFKKRKLPDSFDDSIGKENVPPRNPRRTNPSSEAMPPSLSDIRESLSFFLEDSIVPDSQMSLSDSDDEQFEFSKPINFSRTDTNMSTDSIASNRSSVVNRLLRTDSEDSMASKPLAFQTGAVASNTFKVPSLLRRATNLSTASSGSNTPTGGAASGAAGGNGSGVRIGGSRRSNIHYAAREAERKMVIDAAETKRRAQVKSKVLLSKGRSILGMLKKEGSGFE